MQQPGYMPQYRTEVNKGSVNMRWLTGHLNDMSQQGWHLHFIFEQDKNTVMIFERMVPSGQ
jgi:alpha-acetolactate decarboxylase